MREFLDEGKEKGRNSESNVRSISNGVTPGDIEEQTVDVNKVDTFSSRHPWTLVHSHYVLMGGFAFDSSVSATSFLPPGIRQLKVRPEAITILASIDPNLIPNIPEDEIADKSKANSMAKTIVCLQASWFLVQCISRIRQGIGISLLELNTFAHAICALLVFLLWWDKPLDVGQSSLIRSERNLELCVATAITDALYLYAELAKSLRFSSRSHSILLHFSEKYQAAYVARGVSVPDNRNLHEVHNPPAKRRGYLSELFTNIYR